MIIVIPRLPLFRTSGAVLVASASLLAGACGAAGDSYPSASLDDRMLPDSEFPAGTQVGAVSDPSSAYTQLSNGLKQAEMEPAECGEHRVEAADRAVGLPSRMRRAGLPSGSIVTVTVSEGAIPRELIESTVDGPCSSVAATSFNGEFAVETTHQTSTFVDEGADRLVYEQVNEARSELPGDTSPPRAWSQREGFVWADGFMVRVAQSAPELDAANRAEFDDVLVAAGRWARG